jgi:hypothetical protein
MNTFHRSSRKDPARRREQHPVAPPKRRPARAPRQHLDLMSQHQKFGFPFQVAAI